MEPIPTILEITLILALTFFIRSFFLVSRSSDDYVHLWNIKLRKILGNPWKHEVSNSLIKGKRGYPPLLHYLISLFPERYWRFSGRLFNIISDCLSILIIYFLTALLFKHYGASYGRSYIVSPQGAVSLVVATAPILMPTTSRLLSVGTRAFGFLLSLVYFIFLGIGLLYNPLLGTIACVLTALVMVLSSQFAAQNFFFLTLLLGIFYASPIPFIILLIVGLISWMVPWLGIRSVVSFRYAHIKWYWRNQRKSPATSDRNSILNVLKLPINMFKAPEKAVKTFFYDSSFIIAAYSLPALLASILIILLYGNFDQLLGEPEAAYALYVAAGSIIIFLITSLRPFHFLGQAERYFDFSLPYIALIFVLLVFVNDLSAAWILYIVFLQIILVSVNFLVVNRADIFNKLLESNEHDLEELAAYLKQNKNLRILTIPIKNAFQISVRVDGSHKFYYRAINEEADGRGFDNLDEDSAFFELPLPKFDHFKKKYGVNTIIVVKDILDYSRKMGVDYDFSPLKKLFENDTFLVYKL